MQDRVIKIVCEATKTDPSKVGPDTSFVDDLELDSLDIVEMLMRMEDEFGVEISEEETEGLKRVRDVVAYLESKSK